MQSLAMLYRGKNTMMGEASEQMQVTMHIGWRKAKNI